MKNGLIYISFISLLILFWAGTVSAKLEAEIELAPNPAAPNQNISIKFNVWEKFPERNPVFFGVTLLVDNQPVGNMALCSERSGEKSPAVNPCTVEFWLTPSNGQYIVTSATMIKSRSDPPGGFKITAKERYAISGTVSLNNDTTKKLSDIPDISKPTLIISESGELPSASPTAKRIPIITAVDPVSAAINSKITISGKNKDDNLGFCSNIDFNRSNIAVYFKQDSKTASASPQQGSNCTTLGVLVPSELVANKSAEVRVSNIVDNNGGISNSVNLNILPPVVAPWENIPVSQPQGKLQVKWPKNPLRVSLQGDSLTNLVEYLYGWGISLGGFAAFVVLIMAGIQYLTSAGDAGKMKEAIDKIRNAVIGLVMLFASVLILNTINPQLTQLRMPAPRPGSTTSVETVINLEGFQFKPCSGVELYTAADYKPEPPFKTMKEYRCEDYSGADIPMGFGTISFGSNPISVGSIKMIDKGLCQVKLYQKSSCKENEQTITISSDTPDISALGAKSFYSIKLINLYRK